MREGQEEEGRGVSRRGRRTPSVARPPDFLGLEASKGSWDPLLALKNMKNRNTARRHSTRKQKQKHKTRVALTITQKERSPLLSLTHVTAGGRGIPVWIARWRKRGSIRPKHQAVGYPWFDELTLDGGVRASDLSSPTIHYVSHPPEEESLTERISLRSVDDESCFSTFFKEIKWWNLNIINSSLSVVAARLKKIKSRRKVREPWFRFKTMSEVDATDDGWNEKSQWQFWYQGRDPLRRPHLTIRTVKHQHLPLRILVHLTWVHMFACGHSQPIDSYRSMGGIGASPWWDYQVMMETYSEAHRCPHLTFSQHRALLLTSFAGSWFHWGLWMQSLLLPGGPTSVILKWMCSHAL